VSFAQPPQYPRPNSTPWTLIVVIIGLGFTCVAGVIGFAVYYGLKAQRAPVAARPGFGTPVFLDSKPGGWGLYLLPEVPLKVELPSKPERTHPDFKGNEATYMKSWMTYDAFSHIARFTINGIWYTHPKGVRMDYVMRQLEQSFVHFSAYSNFTFKTSEAQIGAEDGLEMVGDYTYDDHPYRVLLFLWKHGDVVYYMQSHAAKENAVKGRIEYERLLRSLDYSGR